MKKEHAVILILIAFAAGFVAGVIAAVYHQENFSSLPRAAKPSPAAGKPDAQLESLQQKIPSLQAALKENPKNLPALIEMGNLYFDTDQFTEAINYYLKALEIDPNNANVRTDLGIMYRRKGEFDKAISEFQRAAKTDPHHVNSRYNLGVVLLHDKNDLKGAIKAWEEYLQLEPNGPKAENIRSQIGKMKAMIQ